MLDSRLHRALRLAAFAILVLFAAVVLAACADEKRPDPTPTPTPTPTATPSPADPCAGVTPVRGFNVRKQLVATGLGTPVHLVNAPDEFGRYYVVLQFGRIQRYENNIDKGTFLNIEDKISFGFERGLLSMAFHPNYPRDSRFYVLYTEVGTGDVLISQFRATSPEFADPASETRLERIRHRTFDNHNGGHLLFDRSGYLFASIGDGGGDGDTLKSGQDTSTNLGKLLRLDINAPSLVPPGNPYGNLIWHTGLRNPWRFTFDPLNGDLYLSDVGDHVWEEINFVAGGGSGGENWGWSAMEGPDCFNDPGCGGVARYKRPLLAYDHSEGCSITGGVVYRGCALPDLRGYYLYADWCFGWVKGIKVEGGRIVDEIDLSASLTTTRLASFGEDAQGEIYILSTAGGAIEKIVPR